jgi:hypothetical protein
MGSRIGTYFENGKLLDMLPIIENYLRRERIANEKR